jgi:hypothetical protein
VQVFHDGAVRVLRAEQNDLGVLADLDRVAGRPVKEIASGDRLMLSIPIGDGNLAFD